jgi:ubiquinone/menaquinone biosynthesis C-methylase UbiE
VERDSRSFTGNFDPLARRYRALEVLAFGTSLERTRFQYVDRLRDCRRVLIYGEGDGRFLRRLLDGAPHVTVDCIDSSAAMQQLAASRLSAEERRRVRFVLGDARTVSLPAGDYDGVVTCFFLDCFSSADVDAIVTRTASHLRADARWLFADFVVPEGGRWRRLRAHLWLALLYRSFGLVTGMQNRSLPASEEILARHGFRAVAATSRQAGLLRAVLLHRRIPPGH